MYLLVSDKPHGTNRKTMHVDIAFLQKEAHVREIII